MTILLLGLICLVFYSYLGYGVLMAFLLKVKGDYPTQSIEGYTPSVSLIIPAYNEVDYILKKVENSLSLDYPADLLEIIFITDGSNDGTAELLSKVDGIIHLHKAERGGKAAAMNRAVKKAKGDILVFCDANTELNKEALFFLVAPYADAKVGGVSGEKKIIAQDVQNASSAGEGIYWKYESFLKRADSRLYTIVGAAGELMSYRKSLYQELEPDTLLDDFMQSMRVVLKGYRVLYEPRAIAMETASADVKEELKRKVRICAGGWQSMQRLLPALNVFKRPVVAFTYFSHRVLRWSLAAFALPVIFFLNVAIVLLPQPPFWSLMMMLAQIAFYTAALIGWFLEHKHVRVKLLYVPYYFFIMNLAVFLGFWRYLKGSQSALWERAKRAS